MVKTVFRNYDELIDAWFDRKARHGRTPVTRFMDGSRGSRMWFSGSLLCSYEQPVAYLYRPKKVIVIDDRRYSATTTRQLLLVRSEARRRGYDVLGLETLPPSQTMLGGWLLDPSFGYDAVDQLSGANFSSALYFVSYMRNIALAWRLYQEGRLPPAFQPLFTSEAEEKMKEARHKDTCEYYLAQVMATERSLSRIEYLADEVERDCNAVTWLQRKALSFSQSVRRFALGDRSVPLAGIFQCFFGDQNVRDALGRLFAPLAHYANLDSSVRSMIADKVWIRKKRDVDVTSNYAAADDVDVHVQKLVTHVEAAKARRRQVKKRVGLIVDAIVDVLGSLTMAFQLARPYYGFVDRKTLAKFGVTRLSDMVGYYPGAVKDRRLVNAFFRLGREHALFLAHVERNDEATLLAEMRAVNDTARTLAAYLHMYHRYEQAFEDFVKAVFSLRQQHRDGELDSQVAKSVYRALKTALADTIRKRAGAQDAGLGDAILHDMARELFKNCQLYSLTVSVAEARALYEAVANTFFWR